MIILLYVLIFIGWFFLGIPLNILGFILGYKELKKKCTDGEQFAIKFAMVLNVIMIIIILLSVV